MTLGKKAEAYSTCPYPPYMYTLSEIFLGGDVSLLFLEPQLRQAREVLGAKLYRAGYIYSYHEIVHIFRQKPSLQGMEYIQGSDGHLKQNPLALRLVLV